MPASRDPVVEIAFAGTPLTVSPTWTDLTSRLRSLDVDRQYDPLLRRWLTGRASVVLDNLDRALEPGYSGSAFFPNVKRRRQLRITVPAYVLDLPGTTGHFASTPDVPSLDITGDMIVWGRFAADDWTPAARQVLVSRFDAGGSNRHHMLSIEATTGRPRFFWAPNGTSVGQLDATATAAPSVSDGGWIYVLVWLDVDNGAVGNDTRFYTSPDGVTWTQLGTTVTKAGTTVIGASSMPLEVGARSNGSTEPFAGLVGEAHVLNGGSIVDGLIVGGTEVASPSFDQPVGTTAFTDDQGLPWTVSGASSAFVATTSYPRFRGLIDAIIPTYGANGRDATVELRCTDLAGYLAEIDLEVPYVKAVLADTPWAYWRLAEAGTVGTDGLVSASDSSGNGRSGLYTPLGGITYGRPDAITDDADGAITLDGAVGFVGVPPAPIVNLMAVEAWFKTSSATFQRILDQQYGGTVDLSLVVTSGGAVIFQYGQSATSGIWEVTSSTGHADGAWHHVVGLVDVTGVDMFIWIDGAEDSASTSTAGTPAPPSGAPFMTLGVNLPSASPQYFNGSLSDVAVYSGNHPAIATHYAARNAGLGDFTGDRITRITNDVGIPLALTQVDDGLSEMTGAGDMGTQTAVEAIRVAELTEAGALYVDRSGILRFANRAFPHGAAAASTTSRVTYTGDSGTGTKYSGDPQFATLTSDFANSIRNVRRNGATLYASDETSIAEDGLRTVHLSTASATDAEAASRASWELALRSADEGMRARRLDFVVVPNNASAVLGREVWDRVTVEWDPPGAGAPLSQEALVVGVADRWAPGAYRVRLSLDPTETLAVWRLGVAGASELGTTTRLFF